MFNNGTVSKNSSYEDICTKQFVNARLAYPIYRAMKVDNETKTMIEQDIYAVHGVFSSVPWDWEILKPFLMNHNILVTWIPCHAEFWGEAGSQYKVPQCHFGTLH